MSVFELIPEPAADFNPIFGRDRYVAAVEEAVEIAPEEQAVIYGMGAVLVERLDVGRFERWQGMLFGYRAGPVVGVRNQNAEGPLAQARLDRCLFAVSCLLLFDPLGFLVQVIRALMLPAALQVRPDEPARLLFEFVALGLAPDDGAAPIRGGEPHRFVEKERLGQDNAADLEILMRIIWDSPVTEEPLAHSRIGAGAVPVFESLPGQADRQDGERGEDPTAGDQVPVAGPLASMELKEEEFSGADRAELRVR